MDLLKLRNATAWRGTTRVFESLDVTIPLGESTAILGPNGSGKTTLLEIATRYIYPNPTPDCLVEVMGQQRWSVWELRKRLGYVSHDRQQSYGTHVSGFDVVASGYFASEGIPSHLELTPERRQRVDAILVEHSIEHLRSKQYGAMSSGEQRRCLLARALVCEPDALVLDEPTMGLDIPTIFHYLRTARRLIQQGTTLVISTHHVHEIPPEISNVVLLKNGRVFGSGTKTQMLTSEVLSELFETSIQVIESNGYLAAVPGKV